MFSSTANLSRPSLQLYYLSKARPLLLLLCEEIKLKPWTHTAGVLGSVSSTLTRQILTGQSSSQSRHDFNTVGRRVLNNKSKRYQDQAYPSVYIQFALPPGQNNVLLWPDTHWDVGMQTFCCRRRTKQAPSVSCSTPTVTCRRRTR